jgi:hypothetical protein
LQENEGTGSENQVCERRGFFERMHGEWLEVVAAILLALATLCSAWCAYQAARWRSLEAERFNEATAARVHATDAEDLADQQMSVDADMFMAYTEVLHGGDLEYASYMEANLFRDEMKTAVLAWKATDPFNNPDAPATPFEMAEYRNENLEQSMALESEAQDKTAEAQEAIRHSDNYILLTVLFASVLFFAGICTKFKKEGPRILVLVTGCTLFAASVVALIFQPFH